ncbi:antibiotic biosynthesis monooxygenase [Microbacterium caowuchunii]|uniref:putative quinol monooxygenase n=1 Tax=Microbacterium caowuchunii TaxID=2614638 RepID=UPI0012475E2D|nr:putative quinol monooxygenase [Microbacterium caowuchunii]QEW01242.1 antibiotic biosynthesis monooxygenase [Microbacterium caowuchunii]
MAYICNAIWTVKDGQADIVRDALVHLAHASRAEPGNLVYQPYQDPTEPNVFRVFEVYADEAAFAAHKQTEHFRVWALGQAIPAVETKEKTVYADLEG